MDWKQLYGKQFGAISLRNDAVVWCRAYPFMNAPPCAVREGIVRALKGAARECEKLTLT